MTEDFIKNKAYASRVEDLLRQKKRIDIQNDFDYKSFLEEFKTPAQGSAEVPLSSAELNVPVPSVLKVEKKASPFVTPGSLFLKQLSAAEEIAALSGKFNPDELLPRSVNINTKRVILSSISVNCLINTSSKLRWHLNRQKRTEALTRLLTENRLSTLLNGSLPVTDIFGKMLRRLLKEQNNIPLAKLKQDEIIALVNVLETVEEIEFPKPSLAEVRILISIPTLLDDYKIISNDFIGRNAELKQLEQFLTAPPFSPPVLWYGQVITGVGGVGKSTLVAKFVEDVISKKQASVAILDFDRPGMNVSDSSWLLREIVLQLAEQYPSVKKELTAMQETISSLRHTSALMKGSTSAKDESDTFLYQFIPMIKELLVQLKVDTLPFLLVLDTVEEIAQNLQTTYLLSLLETMGDLLQSSQLKVILSGRLYDEQLKELLNISSVDQTPITINEFDAAIAEAYLVKKQKLSKVMAGKIIRSRLLPLRPLELKLVAKVLKDGTLSFNALSKELEENKGKGKSKELFTGIIYRRVLMRISDKEVRAIAYPGLILRYITPELLQKVLTPALDLKPVDDKTAGDIVHKLGRFSWLAYKGEKDQVWHRKDLRRSMLQLMLSEEPEKAMRIREAAIGHFSKVDTEEGRAEMNYHRLMNVQKREDGKDLELSQLKQAYKHIQLDMADLPKTARVLLQYAYRRDIASGDINLLPKKYYSDLYTDRGRKLLHNRNFEEAYELIRKGKHLNIDKKESKTEDLLDNWENETLFNMAEWKNLRIRQVFDTSLTSLMTLVNYVFPVSLVYPEKVSMRTVDELILQMLNNKQPFGRGTSRSDEATILSRLASCLMVLHAKRKLSKSTLFYLRKVLEHIKVTDESAIMTKSLALLFFICDGRFTTEYFPHISLLKLDKEWLLKLRPFIPAGSRDTLDHLSYLVYTYQQETLGGLKKWFIKDKSRQETSWKQLQAALTDTLHKDGWNQVRVPLKKMKLSVAYELLKGPEPVFRDACGRAVVDTFRTQKDKEVLFDLIWRCVPLRLKDTYPESIARAITDNYPLAMEHYMEMIDKCWCMGKFLYLASRYKPQSIKLKQLSFAYRTSRISFAKLLNVKFPKKK